MNKEEIEKEDNYWRGYIQKQSEAVETCKICKYRKKYKELEQKESILDKVTDKLKEDIKTYGNHEERKQMCKEQLYENDGKWFHAREILNFIEGEKK